MGVLPKSLCTKGVHRTIEYMLHQIRNFWRRERLQFKAFQMLIFPDRGDGVRRRFSRANRQYDGGQSAGDELVHGERRQVIEQMRVVDADDHLAIPSIADQPVDHFTHPS